MKFTPVELNSPASTSGTRKGILSIISVGLQGGTRFVSNWLIGSIAGKLVLGAVAYATSLAFTLHILWPASAPSAASKFIARARGKLDDEEVHASANHLSKRVLQTTAVLAFAAPWLWVYLFHGQLWEGLCISAMLITLSTSQYARGIHFGAGQVARNTKVDLLASFIGIALTGVMLSLGVRNLLLTLPLTITLGVYSLLCWPWTATGRPPKALRSEIDKFVTFSAIGSIASAGMLQLSQLIAGRLGAEAAAQYAPALQLVSPLSLITSALIMVIYPTLAEAQGAGDKIRLRNHTDFATRGFMALLIPAFGALAIASRPVIHIVWEVGRPYANFQNAALLMPVFCIALLINNLAAPSVSSITSGEHRHMWYPLLLSQAGFLCAIVVWIFAVPRLGVFGVAVGYGTGAIVTAISLMFVAWWLNKQQWTGLMISVVFASTSIAVLSWWTHTFSPNYWVDTFIGAGFGLAWLALSHRNVLKLIRARQR